MADQTHFRITDIDPTAKEYAKPNQFTPVKIELPVAIASTNILWMFSSWSVIIFNIILACICIRDMFTGAYNPVYHWFMSAAFVATIGGLIAVHTYVLKR